MVTTEATVGTDGNRHNCVKCTLYCKPGHSVDNCWNKYGKPEGEKEVDSMLVGMGLYGLCAPQNEEMLDRKSVV